MRHAVDCCVWTLPGCGVRRSKWTKEKQIKFVSFNISGDGVVIMMAHRPRENIPFISSHLVCKTLLNDFGLILIAWRILQTRIEAISWMYFVICASVISCKCNADDSTRFISAHTIAIHVLGQGTKDIGYLFSSFSWSVRRYMVLVERVRPHRVLCIVSARAFDTVFGKVYPRNNVNICKRAHSYSISRL